MKKFSISTIIGAAIFLTCITGCASMKKMFVKETPVLVREAQTNFVTVQATNFVPVAASSTNESGAVTIQTNLVPQIVNTVQPVILPAIYYTNLALSDGAASGVTMAGNVAGAAGVPFASTGSTVLLALSTLIFGFLNKKNKNKAQAEADGHEETKSALATALLVGKTLTENFETVRNAAKTIPAYTPEIDAKVMSIVKNAQALAGGDVKSAIHDLVEEHTDHASTLPVAA